MFYQYRQNNSGGSFIKNSEVNELVIIEAENDYAADDKAAEIGIYFDGCENDIDCGDRWSRSSEGGTKVPSYYGEPLGGKSKPFSTKYNHSNCLRYMDGHDTIIYYADGRVRYTNIPS